MYSTCACLPSVLTSFLNVVNSILNFLLINVTVPCFIPVSKTLKFVFLNFSLISFELKTVATSISSIFSLLRCFLTQPPTNLAVVVSSG